jgi:hypothetical protein
MVEKYKGKVPKSFEELKNYQVLVIKQPV